MRSTTTGTRRVARAAAGGAVLLLAALSTQGALSVASADEPGGAGQPGDCAVELAVPLGDGPPASVPLAGPAEVERAPEGCPVTLSGDALGEVEEVRACLTEHGVELPAPGPAPARTALSATGDVGDALDRAREACAPGGGFVVQGGPAPHAG